MPSLPRLLAVALCLALTAGCIGDDRPGVAVEEVSAGEVVERVSAPARVAAAARQDVAAAVSGVVVALEVTDGDAVTGGQPVVRLESSQLDLARDQAAAAAAATASAGITLDGGGAATRARAVEAVTQLDAQTRPRIDDARNRASAISDPDQRAAALSAVDAVEASYLTTRTTILASADALATGQDDTARALSDALNQAVEQATAAQRAQAEAAADALARQAGGLVATAPFGGVVRLGGAAATDGGALAGLPPGLDLPPGLTGGLGALGGASGGGTLRVGAPVNAGQTLFTVYDLSQLYVTADIDEVDAPAVRAGQAATVLIDAFPGMEFDGVVESVDIEAATTEAGGVGFPARVRIVGPDVGVTDGTLDGVRVGMTASVEVATRSVDAALVVPSRSLVRRDAGTVVFVVRDGRAEEVEVTVGVLGDDDAAVEGDLAVGDAVVVSGFEGLADGDEVAAGP